MAVTYIENGDACLLEGTYLLPEYMAELHAEFGDSIRSCFMGYCEINTSVKVRHLREYGAANGELDWTSDDDDEALESATFLKSFSVYVKTECDRYGLTYFERSSDHQETIATVVRFLRR